MHLQTITSDSGVNLFLNGRLVCKICTQEDLEKWTAVLAEIADGLKILKDRRELQDE